MDRDTAALNISPIVVTHCSEKYLDMFWGDNSKELESVVTVVNSSDNHIKLSLSSKFTVIEANDNVGFAAGNNIGISHCMINSPDYFLIINPDVKLPPGWLSNLKRAMWDQQNHDVGIFAVPLMGYEFDQNAPTGYMDSMGIGHTWYGRWYDALQGKDVSVLNEIAAPYEIFAACGALMLIRSDAVHELLQKDGYVFNEEYFMYKEDIELSLRLRRLGKNIMMLPSVPVYHCRGWANNRADSPYWARRLSVINELKMHYKYYWKYLPYSILKYIYVNTLERLLR